MTLELVVPAPAAAPWLAAALWLVARGTVLLALAGLAVLALRRGPAAARHLAWGLALAGLLGLPALSLLAPRWELPFVRVAAPGASGGALAPVAEALPAWGAVLLALWAAGAAAVLARYALAVRAARLAAAEATDAAGAGWAALLGDAARQAGLREPVRLLRAPGAAMPVTWGILRPVVLLPAGADGWSEERRRVVLLHELAHVARRDCLWQAVASVCCAAYWFHPGVWWAARRMRIEREQACDDRVLGAGTRPSDYAAHLVEVARACRSPRATAAVAMAARSQLEERVLAVLDGARARGAVPLRAASFAAALAAVALLPLAAARPDGAAPPREPEPGIRILAAEVVHEPAGEPAEAPPMAATPTPFPAPPAEPAPPAPTRVAEAPAREPAPRRLRVDEERAIAALLRATDDPDPEVRRGAVAALGRRGGDAVVGSLVRSMDDADARVRSAAVAALGEVAARRPSPSSASATRAAPPPAARAAPSAPVDPALRILGGLTGDTTYAHQPPPPGPGPL